MSGHLGRSVSIIGVGCSPIGDLLATPELDGFGEHELFTLAAMEAMENGNIEAKDIDAYYLGWVAPNYYGKVQCASPHYAEWLGLRYKPSYFHDEGCATFNVGLQQAVMAVASGTYDCVLAGGVNVNMSEPELYLPQHMRKPMDPGYFWGMIGTAVEPGYEKPGASSLTPLVEDGLITYCKKYGVTFDQLAQANINYVKIQRNNALKNPKAALVVESFEEEADRFGFDSVDEYLMSDIFNPKIGLFLRAKWSGMMIDGASAVIVCETEKAKQIVKKPIEVAGFGAATARIKDGVVVPTNYQERCYKMAYSMAGITDPANEVDYLSVHDCPAANIFLVSETCGYFEPGQSWKAMVDGRVAIDGGKPINTSGGRTQMGHPTAAANGIEIGEAVMQMRGEAGERQIPNPPKVSMIEGGGAGISETSVILRTI